jgi:hypothetical protein
VIDLMIRKIVDDDISPHLRPSISIHRFNVRRIEKNRFPVKHSCAVCGWSFLCRNIEQYVGRQYYLGPDKRGNVRHVCCECGLENKVKLAAGTLYHLIDAVPRAERDSLEIYPGDWREALVPRPLKTGWDWRKLEEWAALGWNMIGVGEYLDKCEASSYKSQSWNRDRARIKFDPADAVLLAGRENRETWRIARAGGSVEHPERSAKRHGRLAGTRAAYNEQWGPYTNNGRLSRTLRELRSLNIPRETIEARNAMIAKLEHDFAPRDEARAA